MAFANIVRVVTKYEQQGGEAVNVYHLGSNDDMTGNLPENLSSLANQFVDLISEWLLIGIPTKTRFTYCAAQLLLPFRSDSFEQSYTHGVIQEGAWVGDPLPSFAAQLATIYTEQGGRGKRGRVYLPAPPVDGVDGEFLNADHYAILKGYTDALLRAYTGFRINSSWTLGVLERQRQGVPTVLSDDALHEAYTIVPRQDLSMMRSRKLGNGR